jgi:hypothetical protein
MKAQLKLFVREHGLMSVSIFSLMPCMKGIVWRIYPAPHGPKRQDGAAMIFLT